MTAAPDYYDSVNGNLVDALTPPTGLDVLEIGCGSGGLGERMKAAGARLWVGVEIVPEAAARALPRLDRVIVGDVERMELPLEPASFDALVLGDVVEHLADPWTTLRRLCTLLKPRGRLIASIPNVNHASIFVHLLNGRWEYQERGLLDRTHLRFFTLEEVLHLLASAGLSPESVQSCRNTTPELDLFLSDLELLRRKYKLGSDRFPTEARTWQWLVQARKSA